MLPNVFPYIARWIVFSVILGGMTVGSSAMAQTRLLVRELADLNPGSGGSFPSNRTLFNGEVFFSAYTAEARREFWKYDGRSIVLVLNINDTVLDIGYGTLVGNDSAPYDFKVLGQELCFTAFDPRRGGEPWRSDGTNAFRTMDLNADLNDLIKLICAFRPFTAVTVTNFGRQMERTRPSRRTSIRESGVPLPRGSPSSMENFISRLQMGRTVTSCGSMTAYPRAWCHESIRPEMRSPKTSRFSEISSISQPTMAPMGGGCGNTTAFQPLS
jgi:ELWxxDGT repeat protein